MRGAYVPSARPFGRSEGRHPIFDSTNLTPGQRRTTWLAVVIPYTLWFAVAWSAAINGVFLIAHVFNTEVRGLFSKPIFALLPWILGAIPSAFLVYSVGVRLMERRKVDVPSNFDSRLSLLLSKRPCCGLYPSPRVYKLMASFSRRVCLADRPLKPPFALSIVNFHNLR